MKPQPKILKDAQNKTIHCQCPGCRRAARHIHHKQYRSEGGTDAPENLVYMCQKCHIAHHSRQGDFSRWGKQGGRITAQKMIAFRNLKQFKGEDGAKRYEVWVERNADVQMGLAS